MFLFMLLTMRACRGRTDAKPLLYAGHWLPVKQWSLQNGVTDV